MKQLDCQNERNQNSFSVSFLFDLQSKNANTNQSKMFPLITRNNYGPGKTCIISICILSTSFPLQQNDFSDLAHQNLAKPLKWKAFWKMTVCGEKCVHLINKIAFHRLNSHFRKLNGQRHFTLGIFIHHDFPTHSSSRL